VRGARDAKPSFKDAERHVNKEPNWLPMQPTDLAVAEAAFGAVPVRSVLNEQMVDVHWLDDGTPVVDWSDVATAVPIWTRWNTKSKAARRAALAAVAHEEWLAGLLAAHEEQVRDRIKHEARAARRTAVQRRYLADEAADATAEVHRPGEFTVSFDDLLAEVGEDA
jgi:hypothetical protein